MYASVRTYSAGSELAEALARNADAVKGIVSRIDGFKAYYLVRTGDGVVSVSVYEDEAGADESNKAAAAWMRENLADVQGSSPQVSAGEVLISA